MDLTINFFFFYHLYYFYFKIQLRTRKKRNYKLKQYVNCSLKYAIPLQKQLIHRDDHNSPWNPFP
jgi:hypothetical protein